MRAVADKRQHPLQFGWAASQGPVCRAAAVAHSLILSCLTESSLTTCSAVLRLLAICRILAIINISGWRPCDKRTGRGLYFGQYCIAGFILSSSQCVAG
jgi:hypothetical protein